MSTYAEGMEGAFDKLESQQNRHEKAISRIHERLDRIDTGKPAASQ